MKKIVTAVTAAALMATAPAMAQVANTPAPAAETNLGKQGESAQFGEMGAGAWVLGAIVVGLAVWGFIELIDDGDEPASP